jgi:hypothetical protein
MIFCLLVCSLLESFFFSHSQPCFAIHSLLSTSDAVVPEALLGKYPDDLKPNGSCHTIALVLETMRACHRDHPMSAVLFVGKNKIPIIPLDVSRAIYFLVRQELHVLCLRLPHHVFTDLSLSLSLSSGRVGHS